MIYKIGLIGLPNVGKSSLFHFLTKKKDVKIGNYPFTTIEADAGIIPLVDPRLEKLSEHWKSRRTIFSAVEIIDIAGLVKGASEGLGRGNEFLSDIREVDLFCHVLRCFPEKEVVHVEKTVNPIRDFEIVQLELILSDLQQIEKRLTKLKARDEKTQQEKEILQLIQKSLEKEVPINQLTLSEAERKVVKNYNFLTSKPMFLLANYSSNQEKEIQALEKYAQAKSLSLFPLAVKLETDLTEFSLSEREGLGWKATDFSRLTEKIKELLGLKTFFTVGEDEVKSWLTKKTFNARECAGLIHSDIQKNFIEVKFYNYQDWLKFSSEKELNESGKIRRAKANYVVQEGDICYFLFNKR